MVSVRLVDTTKGTEENPETRCRLVSRDFRGSDKDLEDLFSRLLRRESWKLMSRAADRPCGKTR